MTYAEEKLLIFFGQVRPPLWNYFKPVKAPPPSHPLKIEP